MINRLNLAPDQCCYVGDSLSDVKMARAAGIKIFSVATGENSKEELARAGSDWVLNRLEDLMDKLMPRGREIEWPTSR
jgi:phosphoglycolate phosphatase-like HAD superfamily hydrolase